MGVSYQPRDLEEARRMKAALTSYEELERLQEEDRAEGRANVRTPHIWVLGLDDDALAALAERLRPFLAPNGGKP